MFFRLPRHVHVVAEVRPVVEEPSELDEYPPPRVGRSEQKWAEAPKSSPAPSRLKPTAAGKLCGTYTQTVSRPVNLTAKSVFLCTTRLARGVNIAFSRIEIPRRDDEIGKCLCFASSLVRCSPAARALCFRARWSERFRIERSLSLFNGHRRVRRGNPMVSRAVVVLVLYYPSEIVR